MAAVRVIASKSPLRRGVAILLVGTMLAGCAQQGGVAGMGGKETTGTALGAALGAGAGALFGGKGKLLAMAVGTAAGAIIGNRIGAMLDEQDQKAIAEQSRMALLAKADNSSVDWTSTHSGATATVTPSNTRTERRQIKVVRDARVQRAPNLDAIGADYTVLNATNVRSAPGTDSDVVGRLEKGATVWAVGGVHRQPWVMVAQHGVTIGYVAESQVRAAGSKSVPVQVAGKSFDLDAAPPVRAPVDLDAIASSGAGMKVETVTASVTCRDLSTIAKFKGDTQTSTETACRAPDGSWAIN
jgi:surface antigen